MISWIMTTRADGYGGTAPMVADFAMRRLRITISSILALPVDREVIVVDWNPPIDKETLDQVLHDMPVRVIRVDQKLQDILEEDGGDKSISFYEYVAKEIGIRLAKNKEMILCNPDNIFPDVDFEDVAREINGRVLVRASRLDIDRENAKFPDGQLIEMANKGEFPVLKRFDSAGGDFCGMTKKTYNNIGGYSMVHGNWHVDNYFEHLGRISGFEIIRPYYHYHIDHDNSAIEAKERSAEFDKYKPIDRRIIKELLNYAREVS